MSIILKSGDSADLASVDANKRLKINLPMELADAGYSVLAGESHDGQSGEPRLVRAARVSTDGRLRVGLDNIYWADIQSMPVGTPIGGALTPIDVNLDAPLYVAAGTFAHVILRIPVATATASQIIRGLVMINGYFE